MPPIRARGRPPTWTEERIVETLRRVAGMYGGPITIAAWHRHEILPSPPTIVQRFGSWPAAWRAAGFPYHTWTRPRDEILAVMRAVAREHGGLPLTKAEWQASRLRPCAATIVRAFGSWSAAWSAAGVTPPRLGASHRGVTARYRQRHEQFVALVRDGVPVPFAAQQAGVSASTAYYWAAQIRVEEM